MLFIFHAKDQNIKYVSVPNSVLSIKVTHSRIPLELETPTKTQHVRDSTNSKSV